MLATALTLLVERPAMRRIRLAYRRRQAKNLALHLET